MKKNDKAIFLHINQADKELTRAACTIYSLFINLAYNTWIRVPESEIEKVVKKQIDNWLLDIKKGWRISNAKKAVLDYLKENKDKYPQEVDIISFHNNSNQFWNYLENWYAITTWINVNKDFVNDIHEDWKLDLFKDYSKYKWDYKHATNFLIWKSRFGEPSSDHNKQYNLDSYFKHKDWEWLRTVDLEEVRENILQNSGHVFILKDYK